LSRLRRRAKRADECRWLSSRKLRKNSKSYPHIRLFYFAVENYEWGIKLKVSMRRGVLRRDICRNTNKAEMAREKVISSPLPSPPCTDSSFVGCAVKRQGRGGFLWCDIGVHPHCLIHFAKTQFALNSFRLRSFHQSLFSPKDYLSKSLGNPDAESSWFGNKHETSPNQVTYPVGYVMPPQPRQLVPCVVTFGMNDSWMSSFSDSDISGAMITKGTELDRKQSHRLQQISFATLSHRV